MHVFLIAAALMATQPEAKPDAPAPAEPANLLVNPSFEEPVAPQAQPVDPHVIGEWWSFTGPERPYWRHFEISDEHATEGAKSVRLTLDSEGFDGPTLIVGATQNVKAGTMPGELSGMVRVDGWERGTARQYVQIVVIVWNVTGNYPPGAAHKNYQIAYTFAGIEEPPFAIQNRKFLFPRGEKIDLHAEDGNPVEGEWKRFDLNPREDFKAHWGVDPSDYEYIRVLYEVRYDGRQAATEPPAHAVVHWDDLYFGERRAVDTGTE